MLELDKRDRRDDPFYAPIERLKTIALRLFGPLQNVRSYTKMLRLPQEMVDPERSWLMIALGKSQSLVNAASEEAKRIRVESQSLRRFKEHVMSLSAISELCELLDVTSSPELENEPNCRVYESGDDIRCMDWNEFRKTGDLVIRLN